MLREVKFQLLMGVWCGLERFSLQFLDKTNNLAMLTWSDETVKSSDVRLVTVSFIEISIFLSLAS